MSDTVDIELTEQDLAEALGIAAAVRAGHKIPRRVEARHVLAVVEWGARCEKEAMAAMDFLDKFDKAKLKRIMTPTPP